MSRRAKSDPILRERSSRFQQKVELSIEKRGRSQDRPLHRATALTGGL